MPTLSVGAHDDSERQESGWVSYTEMWCRLAPKGASPLVMLLPRGGTAYGALVSCFFRFCDSLVGTD